MGVNISGIAVSKNFQNDLAEIEKEIGFRLKPVEEINFETASSNWKEDGICDIYFGENSSLIFLNHELSMDAYSIMNLPTLTFAISETASAFCFHYCENGKIRRSRAEAEGQKLPTEGDRLDIEYTNIDLSEIIRKLIDKTIGHKFIEIDLADKAYRYQLIKIDDSKQIVNRLRIPLLIFKYSKWLIITGLIFTILSLTNIFYNRFGFLVIIFGVLLRKALTWFINNRMIRDKK